MKNEKGFTLIELLIASIIAVLILGALSIQLSSQLNTSMFNVRRNVVSNAVRSTLDLMAQDIKRAGYSANPSTASNFTDKTQFNIYSIKTAANGGSSCITFAYDRKPDTGVSNGVLDTNERFGFALKNNAIVSYQGTSTADCNNLNSDWVPITNIKSILVTNLVFSLVIPATPSGTPTEVANGFCPISINISITAKDADGKQAQDTFQTNQNLLVRLRNDTANDWTGSNCAYNRP